MTCKEIAASKQLQEFHSILVGRLSLGWTLLVLTLLNHWIIVRNHLITTFCSRVISHYELSVLLPNILAGAVFGALPRLSTTMPPLYTLEQWLQNRLLLVAMGLGVAWLGESGELSSCLLRPTKEKTNATRVGVTTKLGMSTA